MRIGNTETFSIYSTHKRILLPNVALGIWSPCRPGYRGLRAQFVQGTRLWMGYN